MRLFTCGKNMQKHCQKKGEEEMIYFYSQMKSPLGELTLVANEKKLIAILWEEDDPKRVKIPGMKLAQDHSVLDRTEFQLREYFSGKRKFFDVPLEFRGTEFQIQVWKGLQSIPYGITQSYGSLAKQIGSPKASRAVGAANGRNPISIIVPCHRVIGADGSLTGFAGGMKAKSYLLALEKSS
jgi:methylated-DNA-[protein]-cysteine S-methyltransferase